MALRKQTNPREMDLQPEMRDILMRNGMQAHIIAEGGAYKLAVQSHDSPLLTYDLTQKQLLALTDWGTNSANKKAYNVFTSIVANDFYMPRNFVHARNANGRVAMGLHGYRVGTGEYGRGEGRGMWGPGILGWTPRHQEGMHLRRVGGQLFYQGAPIVAERSDGRMKPGELQSGAYGFYYRHTNQQQTAQQQDVLQSLQAIITPVERPARSQEPAVPYNELITSDVYFSNEKWQECLQTHGIIIDEHTMTLTIQSKATDMDMVYDLTQEELSALTDNSIRNNSVQQRLDIINNVIGGDFTDKVTKDMLNSKERIGINLHPELLAELQTKQEMQLFGNSEQLAQQQTLYPAENVTDGRDLENIKENKYFAREGKHGREVDVSGIRVDKAQGVITADGKVENKYLMTAIINGESVTHEISQKQYDKFLALDDYHRMKLFAKVFPEVDLKSRPGTGANIGAQILGALTAGLYVAGDIAHGVHRLNDDDRPGHDHDPHVRVYGKPGVDSPNDIAARQFEALANREVNEMRRGY